MISKHDFVLLLFFAVVFLLLPGTTSATTDGSECSAQDLLALLRANDPVYTDATELAHILSSHGFTIKCLLQSKSVRLFEGQKGAALYRTNLGDFEVLFLPKAETFAVQPIELRKNGAHIYSFKGSPRSKGPWYCARSTYFTQHGNRLFVTEDGLLTTALDKALASSPA